MRESRRKFPITTSENTDFSKVHKYFIKILKCKNERVEEVIVKKGLTEKTGFLGIVIFEEKKIFLEQIVNEKDYLLTILHELFHVYFDDTYLSKNKKEEDIMEDRADKSAENMLNWYLNNSKQFFKFLSISHSLPLSKFTKKDEELII